MDFGLITLSTVVAPTVVIRNSYRKLIAGVLKYSCFIMVMGLIGAIFAISSIKQNLLNSVRT